MAGTNFYYAAIRRDFQLIPQELGDRHHQAAILQQLSIDYAELGQTADAIAQAVAALQLHDKLGSPGVDELKRKIGEYEAIAKNVPLAPQSKGPVIVDIHSQATNPQKGPGILRQAASALKAAAAFVGSGLKRVNIIEYQERLAVCNTCPQHTGMRCRLCGCFTSIKARLPHEDCPLGQWPRSFAPLPMDQVQHVRKTGSISLCMIVKNEEANLPACLASIYDLVDEIIVVDTGSSDRTKQIALQHGARVFDFPWIDDFATARNETLRYATGDWIFWLDADDRLDAANRRKFQELRDQLDSESMGYIMQCLCLPDAQNGAETVVDHVRLFRRHPEIRWRFRIHEQVLPAIRRMQGKIQWSDVCVHHVGYQDPATRQKKIQRDMRLLQLEEQDHPDEPFTLFNLGSLYHEQGQWSEAIRYLERSLQRSHPTDSIVRKTYALLAQCQRKIGRVSQALETCVAGRQHYPRDVELLFQEALARQESHDLPGAEACLLQLIQVNDQPHFKSVDTGLQGYKARHNLAVIYQQMRRWAEAETQWRQALEHRRDFMPAWLGLAYLNLAQKDWKEVATIIQALTALPRGHFEAELLRGRLALAQGQFQAAQDKFQELIQQNPSQLPPRVFLSHAYLQEGKDMQAAEQALRSVLALDPKHAESKRNLDVLLSKMSKV